MEKDSSDEIDEYKQTRQEINKTFKNAGFDLSDINNMIKTVKNNSACDTKCQNEKKINNLYNTWQNKLNIKDNIPEQVKEAHKNWCIAAYGEQAYIDYLRKLQENNINRLNKQEEMNNIIQENKIKNLRIKRQSLQNTHENLYEYKSKLIKENQILEIELAKMKGDINKNNRKYDYENIEITRILNSRYIVLFLYYIIFIIYLIFGNFFKNIVYKNKKILFFMILYSVFPFLINYILYISYSEGSSCRGGFKGNKEGECNFLKSNSNPHLD
tara:strand:+ start:697 stop:1509 length:813 start_codon:yes stop_codon:yes gene_type:complete